MYNFKPITLIFFTISKSEVYMQKVELFNTHTFIKELVKSGMEEKTAEVLAENQLAMLETQISTKADMYDVKAHMTDELSTIKKDLDWIKKLMLGIGVTVLIASLKYIFS
ncbi:putative membrane protein [Aliivibrio salmonicida LFI1238]|uniref:Membrane protein n=2 Tax=Vibrionaceae TaxID=641 RepID=B6EHF6_ALISL|nr:putative membrane protein [Aliivibrio salmonicida LFI1238]